MIENVEGRFEAWRRKVENYTIGLVIAVIQSKRAKSLERRPPENVTLP